MKIFEPTQEEIQQKCLEIQASWSEEEKIKRAMKNPMWEVPFIQLINLKGIEDDPQ